MDIEPIITQDTMSALLGRSLTTLETTNYTLFLSIATERLEGLLGGNLPAPVPADLQMVLAQAFNLVTSEQHAAQSSNDGGPVSSKKVEDFSISYDTTAGATWENFLKTYAATIAKYRVVGCVRVSGKACGNDCL